MSAAPAPRLGPLPPERWGEAERAALATAYGDDVAQHLLATGDDAVRMPNVLATLLRHPALAGPFLAFNRVLLDQPTLDPRWRELLILRVAWRARARYEWVQHVRIAARVGISDDELAAVADGAGADRWTPLESDLLRAADELLDRHRVEEATWSRLAAELDDRQLVEVVFVVGTYAALAMAFNSFGLELDPELRDLASASLPHFEE